MDVGSVQTLLQSLFTGADRAQTPAPESMIDKTRKFFEEMSFFAGHFKNFTVRPMPDQPLMLILQKGRWRHKQRKVNKKEKSEGTFMHKPKDKETNEENQETL